MAREQILNTLNAEFSNSAHPPRGLDDYECRQSQVGATLIEVLISIVIFSVGALGLAALQATSLVQSDDTKQRSVALWKAQELVDRMRATKTIDNGDGAIAAYIANVGNDESGIGVYSEDPGDIYSCPANVPTRCDAAGANCNVDELIAYDVWAVMCDPNDGLVAPTNGRSEITGLRNLEVALIQRGGEYRLYFEWLSRTANNSLDTDGVNTSLQVAGGIRNVTSNLCGEDVDVDTRLEVYCVRFE